MELRNVDHATAEALLDLAGGSVARAVAVEE
jgi:hypothetical protein